jgi:hypothetical protein
VQVRPVTGLRGCRHASAVHGCVSALVRVCCLLAHQASPQHGHACSVFLPTHSG